MASAAAAAAAPEVAAAARNVKLLSSDGVKATIDLIAYPTTLINSIRRSILSQVPSVAMVAEPASSSTIRILENTSRLNNQFLSLRISLIPVCLPPPPHGGEVNVLDRYEIRIDKQASTPGITNLTSDDIRVYDLQEKGFLPATIVRQMFPHDIVKEYPGLTHNSNPFLIVPLQGPRGDKEGEKVNLVAKLKVGVGKTHACFSPVCNSTYEIRPIDKDAPSATLDAMGKGDRSKFRFVVESVTTRRAEVLFLEGVDEMIRKLESNRVSLTGAIGANGKGRNCEIHLDGNDVVFRFMNEDHTLGTVLQDYVLRKIKQDSPEQIGDWFIGYRIPHPLTPEMVVRVHIPDSLLQEKPIDTMATLVNEWMLPAMLQAEADLKDIGTRVKRRIPKDKLEHPLAKLLSHDYVPHVERPTSDIREAGLLKHSDGPAVEPESPSPSELAEVTRLREIRRREMEEEAEDGLGYLTP